MPKTMNGLDPREKLGLIAGNGRFPLLVLDSARSQTTGGWVVTAYIAMRPSASGPVESAHSPPSYAIKS